MEGDRVLMRGTRSASPKVAPARDGDRVLMRGTRSASPKATPARDADRDLHAVRHTGVRVVQMHRCANERPNIPLELTSGIGAILEILMRVKAVPI